MGKYCKIKFDTRLATRKRLTEDEIVKYLEAALSCNLVELCQTGVSYLEFLVPDQHLSLFLYSIQNEKHSFTTKKTKETIGDITFTVFRFKELVNLYSAICVYSSLCQSADYRSWIISDYKRATKLDYIDRFDEVKLESSIR